MFLRRSTIRLHVSFSYLAIQYGVYAAYVYGMGVAGALMMFGLLVLRMRMVAPGARSLLEAVYARFGARIHLVMCVISLLNSLGIAYGLISGEFSTDHLFIFPMLTEKQSKRSEVYT